MKKKNNLIGGNVFIDPITSFSYYSFAFSYIFYLYPFFFHFFFIDLQKKTIFCGYRKQHSMLTIINKKLGKVYE